MRKEATVWLSAWINWDNLQETSVWRVGAPTEIRTAHLLNVSQRETLPLEPAFCIQLRTTKYYEGFMLCQPHSPDGSGMLWRPWNASQGRWRSWIPLWEPHRSAPIWGGCTPRGTEAGSDASSSGWSAKRHGTKHCYLSLCLSGRDRSTQSSDEINDFHVWEYLECGLWAMAPFSLVGGYQFMRLLTNYLPN